MVRAALMRHLKTETDAEILVLLHSAGLGKPGKAPEDNAKAREETP
ncbi:MAG: hypothetical protein P8168_01775 [Deltaproteobacteria bacterium]|jgi:hypothetical protein